MFYNKRNLPIIVVFLFFLARFSVNAGEAFLQLIDTSDSSSDYFFYDKDSKENLIKINDYLYSGSTFLTFEKQRAEFVIIKDYTPIGSIVLSENSDFYFYNDGAKNKIYLKMNYGRMRSVIKEGNQIEIELKFVKLYNNGGDFGVITVLNEEKELVGYTIVFNGVVENYLIKDNRSVKLEKWDKAGFNENTLEEIEKFTPEDLEIWQEKMSFNSYYISKTTPIVLESLSFDTIEQFSDPTEDLTAPEFKRDEGDKTDKTELMPPKEEIFAELAKIKPKNAVLDEDSDRDYTYAHESKPKEPLYPVIEDKLIPIMFISKTGEVDEDIESEKESPLKEYIEDAEPIFSDTDDSNDVFDDIASLDETSDAEVPDADDESADSVVIEPKIESKIVVKDQTSDLKAIKLLRFFSSFFANETGFYSYDKKTCVKFVWKPGVALEKEKFEFSFYFPVFFSVDKMFANNMLLPVNNTNNEWSFGSDQNGSTVKIVLDAVDDALLKLRILRYNNINDNFFFQMGELNNFSDSSRFSLVNFCSKIFFPMYRKTSFIIKGESNIFEGFFYAEDILPKGLYGLSLKFMTPYSSFKFKFGIDIFADGYDFMNFDKGRELYFPTQVNLISEFNAFNIPSFSFSIFLNMGALFPLSYNFGSNSSLAINTIKTNPFMLVDNISAAMGLSIRIKKLQFIGEIIADSGLNKIGLFDLSYSAKRDQRMTDSINWLTSTGAKPISISNYNFGARVSFLIDIDKYLYMETSYQATFTYYKTIIFSKSYYDKFFFKFSADSRDKLKINLKLYLEWQIENLAVSIIDTTAQKYETILDNNIFYLGFSIKPHNIVDINIRGGLYPDFYNTTTDMKLLFDCYVSINPEPLPIKKMSPKKPIETKITKTTKTKKTTTKKSENKPPPAK
ncbi:MAG TPA: hypothetical protein PK385_08770 [Spirochaetota bacterium]|nr:hypothetical protein [Spirochaetota bacterium]HOS31856.1 hypothetical protein [Spirochaetota bacterium]HOS56136.1 hypothetical protein [Spirochaetota bacterium]HPK60863.1 hypothetical protein [Spirochaetota bacterium]HQF76679.1 hypothetical protein [Spirochaetota bacterium]